MKKATAAELCAKWMQENECKTYRDLEAITKTIRDLLHDWGIARHWRNSTGLGADGQPAGKQLMVVAENAGDEAAFHPAKTSLEGAPQPHLSLRVLGVVADIGTSSRTHSERDGGDASLRIRLTRNGINITLRALDGKEDGSEGDDEQEDDDESTHDVLLGPRVSPSVSTSLPDSQNERPSPSPSQSLSASANASIRQTGRSHRGTKGKGSSLGDFEGLKDLIERTEDKERAMRRRQMELQEREVAEKRKKRKFEEKKAIMQEVEIRLRVDPTVSWDEAM